MLLWIFTRNADRISWSASSFSSSLSSSFRTPKMYDPYTSRSTSSESSRSFSQLSNSPASVAGAAILALWGPSTRRLSFRIACRKLLVSFLFFILFFKRQGNRTMPFYNMMNYCSSLCQLDILIKYWSLSRAKTKSTKKSQTTAKHLFTSLINLASYVI